MRPLIYTLRKFKRDEKFMKLREKITHLQYMTDIKIFSKKGNEKRNSHEDN